MPFFWSAHYDVTIAYVGHAERWDRIDVDGDLGAGDASVSYWQRGQLLALATWGEIVKVWRPRRGWRESGRCDGNGRPGRDGVQVVQAECWLGRVGFVVGSLWVGGSCGGGFA